MCDSCVKGLKLLVPHVILITMLLGYLALGAFILQLFESDHELEVRGQKALKVRNLFDQVADETWAMRNDETVQFSQWDELLSHRFLQLSQIHDELFTESEIRDYRDINSTWTFPTSLLNCLTILTACGILALSHLSTTYYSTQLN